MGHENELKELREIFEPMNKYYSMLLKEKQESLISKEHKIRFITSDVKLERKPEVKEEDCLTLPQLEQKQKAREEQLFKELYKTPVKEKRVLL